MAFDPTTATEVGGFDISSAKEDEGEASFKDLVKQKFAQAGDMADKGTTLALSNLAGLFQGPEAQDEMFRNLDERIKSRQEWVGKVPEKAALPARIGATVATLPVSIPAMFLDAGASAGKTAIDLGENVSDAQLASLIGMAGAELAAVLPVAGKSFEWWRRGLQGALGNTAQTWITNALQRAAVKQKETKEAFTPKPEDYLDSAILGGAMGMSVRGAKKPSTSFDKKLEALAPKPQGFDVESAKPDPLASFEADPNAAAIKAHAAQLQAEALAREAPPEVIRAQHANEFNPYPVAGDVPAMEGLARAQQEVQTRQLPPDAVVPRDSMSVGPDGTPQLQVPRTGAWPVDENGIPVRKTAPHPTEPVLPPQDALATTPHANELGLAIQDANGPRLGVDDVYGSERLAGPMGAPEPPSFGIGPGRAGPGRGISRGAIAVGDVKKALDDLKKGYIKGPEAFFKFIGTFDTESEHADISKGIGGGHIAWTPAINNSRSPSSKGRLVWMTPDEFHSSALPRYMDSKNPTGIGERKRQQIRTGINDPGGLTSIPVLRLNEEGKIVGHEGRHRMDVMKELGIKKAPVYLHTEGHTNADGRWKKSHMLSEDGKKYVPMPEPIFPMGNEPLSFAPRTEVGQSGIGRGGLTRGGMAFHSKQNKRTEIIQDVLKTGQRAPLPKPEAIVESALADGKDGKGSVWFAAGATLEALKRRSPLIQGVSRVVQHYKNIADSSIRESVFPFEDSVRKLSRTEVEQISKVLKAEMFNRQRFDMAKLAELGLSEKQLLAYSRIREMHGKALEAQNKAREAKGLKPITELDAYLSSRWQGDFRRVFKDKDGNVVWALADNTKRGLETQTASLLKEVPGLTHVDHTVKSARGWRPDYTQVYQTMIDVLGDDPAAAKAKSWYESQVMAAASETRAQEKHFKPKGNIRGFIGDRPGKAGFQESLDMLQQQINYAKNAHKWAAMQEAGLHLKDVLSSKELADAQPNNLRYAREYFADNIGANELAWVKAMEDGIRDLGISPNTIGSGVGTLKAIWVGQKLAANAGFLASNVIQSVNMLPTLAHMQVAYGGNPITSIPSGMLLGTAMAVSHVMGGKGTAVYKGLGQVPGLPTEFIARAMKFAEDNSVIAKSVYDESPIGSSFGIGGLTNKVASKTISLPETFLRSIAYMTYVSQLKSSGKFKSDLDLFRVADEHVRASMGDYGEGERAMAFNKLGNIGNAANVLQTFPINYFNQWSWVSREAAKGNVAPFVTMFAVQASVAGAMGVPGFADADKVLEWIKDYVRDTSPKMWAKIKDFSLKEMVIKLGGESALYGLLSTQSGVALTSRAAAPAATEMAVVPGAPWADAVKQLGSVASAVTDPLNPQKRAQALFDIAPAGLQGYLETGPFKEFTSVTRPDGSTVYGKPSKMAAREGVYARTPEEETLRSFGFRSQKEAATKDALYRARKGEADVKAVVAKLPDKVWNELRLGRKDKAQELFQLHVELTGRGMSKQAITEQLKKEYMTQAEQMIARKNLPLEGLLAYKRFQDMMKEMGYEN